MSLKSSLYGFALMAAAFAPGGDMGMNRRPSYTPPARKPIPPVVPGDQILSGMQNIDTTLYYESTHKKLTFQKTIKISYTTVKNLNKKKIVLQHDFEKAIAYLSHEQLLQAGVIIKPLED